MKFNIFVSYLFNVCTYICYMKNEQLIKSLKNTLTQSEQMWIEEKSHAYIVGYFQGYIKGLINELLDEYND